MALKAFGFWMNIEADSIFDEETLSMLDDKFRMCQAARRIGLSAPEAYLITTYNKKS